MVIIPILVAIFFTIHRHYKGLAGKLTLENFTSLKSITRHRVIVFIAGVHRGSLTALNYARALSDQRIVEAITSGPLHRIGLCYVEWAGPQMQRTPIDWTLVDSKAACERIAAKITALPYEPHSWTGVGAAMRYAAGRFESGPFHSRRMVIDVSGDGRNNNGPPADIVRDELVARNIVINGLPIISDKPNFGRPPDRELDRWYEENVIGGPGSFMMVANGFGDFARAVRNKLSREIA